jgi:hypothetical protein
MFKTKLNNGNNTNTDGWSTQRGQFWPRWLAKLLPVTPSRRRSASTTKAVVDGFEDRRPPRTGPMIHLLHSHCRGITATNHDGYE